MNGDDQSGVPADDPNAPKPGEAPIWKPPAVPGEEAPEGGKQPKEDVPGAPGAPTE